MPFVRASPDGLVSCDCCGSGGLEIKCPYCTKDKSPDSSISYLEDTENGLSLKKNSNYYFQVQAQIHVCHLKYSDFVVWTPHGIHLERIYPDVTHFTGTMEKITLFYKYAILPELVGKWYTREFIVTQPGSDNSAGNDHDDSLELWCYCRRPEGDELMIGCDYQDCKTQWFHCSCLRMKTIPKGKWLCPDCRKVKNKEKLSKSSK